MSITFCFGVSSNLSQEKSPTAEILCKYFLRTIVPRKYMGKIFAVGLFSCDKFEETPKQKVIDMAYLNRIHFSLAWDTLYNKNILWFLILSVTLIIYVMIGNALCATGFGESIAGLLSPDETPNPWIERSVAAFVIIMLTLINLAGVKWVIRLQFLLLGTVTSIYRVHFFWDFRLFILYNNVSIWGTLLLENFVRKPIKIIF